MIKFLWSGFFRELDLSQWGGHSPGKKKEVIYYSGRRARVPSNFLSFFSGARAPVIRKYSRRKKIRKKYSRSLFQSIQLLSLLSFPLPFFWSANPWHVCLVSPFPDEAILSGKPHGPTFNEVLDRFCQIIVGYNAKSTSKHKIERRRFLLLRRVFSTPCSFFPRCYFPPIFFCLAESPSSLERAKREGAKGGSLFGGIECFPLPFGGNSNGSFELLNFRDRRQKCNSPRLLIKFISPMKSYDGRGQF